MSPIRINRQRGKGKPARVNTAPKPVSLPTFSFYGHHPVIYFKGELSFGLGGILRGRRQ